MTRTWIALSALLLSCSALAQQITRADAADWLRGYERAWESRDAQIAADLFTADARYFETPFSEPFQGHEGIAEYWRNVTADQRNVDFRFDLVAVTGATAVAQWSATFELASTGAQLTLDGVFILEFADNGTVSQLREWWVLQP